jgi:hypothetical protein
MIEELKYDDLLGIPFKLGARGFDFYDCWGLCLEIGKRVGISYPPYFTPVELEEQDLFIRNGLDKDFEKINKPEPFCIVTFKIKPPFVDHCGIVMEDCKHFLHIMKCHSVAIQRLDHKILSKRIDGFYKLIHGNNHNT